SPSEALCARSTINHLVCRLSGGRHAGCRHGGGRRQGEDPWRVHTSTRRSAKSAHAVGARRQRRDSSLVGWLRSRAFALFPNHGEMQAADTLRLRIKDELGWAVQVVEHLEEFTLS